MIWTGGDSFLGGDDFDKSVMEIVSEAFPHDLCREIASSVLKAFSEKCEEEGTQCPSLDLVKKDDKVRLTKT